MAGHKEDERFAHILSDPKLQQIKLKEQKSKVDKRFHSLIANSKSKQKCLIDKRGRPVTALSKGGLSRFYDLSDSEEEEDETKKDIHCKGKKEKDILERKNKEEKHEKANKIKNEQKERNTITKKSGGGKEDDDEQTDEEEKMELDVSEEEEDEDETEEDEEEGEDEDEEEETDDGDDETDSDDDEEDEEQDRSSSVRRKNKKSDIEPDYSRGIGNISSSEDDDDEEGDVDQDDYSGEESHAKGPVAAIHPWAEMIEKEVPVVEQSTRRLAICNMNWDYVTAQDLMMLCNSFKPQHGTVISVTIYPTEFGIERMREEHQKGPKEITQVKPNTAKSTTQTTTEVETEEIANAGPSKKRANKVVKEKQSTEKKEEKNSEIVRMYELNRLRYFFAVVECDSVETADQIYTNCDGMEFEKSGTKLDFRYIPDGETFDYEPKSVATSLPASGTYKPPHFVNAAVSRTDVKLSWDRTSHQRLAVTQMDFRKVKNIDELEDQFQEYIAPYTSEEDDDEEGEEPYPDLDWSYIPGELPAKKDVQDMKNVLLELKEGEKEEDIEEAEEEEEDQKSDEDEVHMEFSWDIGLKDSLEGAAKQKKKETENETLTPWEQYQKSKKDKKRQKEREKKRKAKADQKKESDKVKETSVELDNFFLPDGSSDEEKEKPKRQKESLKKRAKKRKREAEEQRLEVDQSVLADPRFADLAKKDFALDPSAPEFRKRRRKF